MSRLALCLCLLLAATCGRAMPKVEDPAGPLTRAETLRALIGITPWLEKAESLCRLQDSSDCTATVRVAVPAGGGHPQCHIIRSAVQDEKLHGLYCMVAQQASFPAKKEDSAFTLAFFGKTSPPPPLSCGNPGGVRDEAHVAPCFDQYNDQLFGLYRKALVNHPDMHGIVSFSLDIRASGVVYGIRVLKADPSLNSDFVADATKLVKSMDFGLAGADATVQHDFNFYP